VETIARNRVRPKTTVILPEKLLTVREVAAQLRVIAERQR
jgi:hypothetical protein